jgi:uncharacterized membrane protein
LENYFLLKFIHLLGVVIFLGNIVVTGWWKFMADRTGDLKIIAFAQRQVTLTDFVFTAGGVVLVAIGGVGNAMLHHMDYLHIKWMAWGYWQFIASGVIWVVVLIPVQIRQAKMARTSQTANRFQLLTGSWQGSGMFSERWRHSFPRAISTGWFSNRYELRTMIHPPVVPLFRQSGLKSP